MIECIIKRDGRKVPFSVEKISNAVYQAFLAGNYDNKEEADRVADKVVEYLNANNANEPTVEEIQDAVERVLVKEGHVNTAKRYILYREERSRAREMNTRLMKIYEGLTFDDAKDNDIKRENANIDGDTSMGTMLKYGSEGAKQFNELYVLKPEHSRAHINGDIHIHDLDFLTLTTTCCQIDINKLFKNGFSTGHGFLREPNSIASYSSLAAIAIQANQNDQHGGQSIPAFDTFMAPGIMKSYSKNYYNNLSKALRLIDGKENDAEIIEKIKDETSKNSLKPMLIGDDDYLEMESKIIKDFGSDNVEKIQKFAKKEATKETDKQTYQAMEAFIHNLNTMHSRAGAQVPFSSITLGDDITPCARMVTKNFLLATDAGLGNGETAIFPVSIFRVKEGINYNPEDPNYDLFKLAMKVSAKRLFPNFCFADATFNAPGYDVNDYNTKVAYMGAVTGEDIITIKCNNEIATLPFKLAYAKYSDKECYIWDGNRFVKIKMWHKYPDGEDWFDVKFSGGRYLRMTSDHPLPTKRGRVLCEDLVIGDEVAISSYSDIAASSQKISPEYDAWLSGMMICDGNRDGVISLGEDERDVAEYIVSTFGGRIKEQKRDEKGNYLDIFIENHHEFARKIYNNVNKEIRILPTDFLQWKTEDRMNLLAGIIDADGYINNAKACTVQIGSTSKQLAIEEMMLAQSLGFNAKMYRGKYGAGDKFRYQVSFRVTKNIPLKMGKKISAIKVEKPISDNKYVTINSIEFVGKTGELRYDVTTESDMFDVSGLRSHNCRTRVKANVYDPSRQITCGRGNLSFTSINLPRIAINANGNVDTFFEDLDRKIDLVFDQLYDRFLIQGRRCVKNYPFLMGQGIWLDSDKLKPDDKVEEILKHGTLTVGFIGLAECLVALIGEHHGQSQKARNLGLEIVAHMRERADNKSKETGMNYTLIATPAEGLSGRFVRMDRERYGVIPGVTDRAYYTNSFHVPVYFPISAFEKIKIEGPYHNLTNAGHISYIEMDGNPLDNLDAFESVIRCMKENNMGYASINHPVDRDPVCGYTGIVGDVCPRCGRHDGEAISEEILVKIKGYSTNVCSCDENPLEDADKVAHPVDVKEI